MAGRPEAQRRLSTCFWGEWPCHQLDLGVPGFLDWKAIDFSHIQLHCLWYLLWQP